MTGRKVTENGNDSAVRWGFRYPWGDVAVCADESEARALVEPPATLVMDDGNGWAVAE